MPSEHSIVFETERLIVRTATVEDADLIYELWTDPRVMAYVGFPRGLLIPRKEIEARIQEPSESEFEQLLIVEPKLTGQAIGQCLMRQRCITTSIGYTETIESCVKDLEAHGCSLFPSEKEAVKWPGHLCQV